MSEEFEFEDGYIKAEGNKVSSKNIVVLVAIVAVVALIGFFMLVFGNKGKLSAEVPEPLQASFFQMKDGSLGFYGDLKNTLVINKDSDLSYLSKEEILEGVFWGEGIDCIVFESFPESLAGLENIVSENTVIYASNKAPQSLKDAYGSKIVTVKKGDSFVCSNMHFTVKTGGEELSFLLKHGKEYLIIGNSKVSVKIAEDEQVVYASMPMDVFIKAGYNNVFYLCFRGEIGDALSVKEKVVDYFSVKENEYIKTGILSGDPAMFMLLDYFK